mmetsp:Transcript_65914/g.169626  ORF Transcript_65914/g.169626 Transcript_65914/m.169626 type:complete len:238 (+) Transcript_65914:777-1490(+)
MRVMESGGERRDWVGDCKHDAGGRVEVRRLGVSAEPFEAALVARPVVERVLRRAGGAVGVERVDQAHVVAVVHLENHGLCRLDGDVRLPQVAGDALEVGSELTVLGARDVGLRLRGAVRLDERVEGDLIHGGGQSVSLGVQDAIVVRIHLVEGLRGVVEVLHNAHVVVRFARAHPIQRRRRRRCRNSLQRHRGNRNGLELLRRACRQPAAGLEVLAIQHRRRERVQERHHSRHAYQG